ncbi:hypothetical protein NP493_570g00023 [Ridgeia piscesae]|uniref:Uncharacterized protein n=1 Tax=Ridgeia piscesae TaxID=27915 RepID=A0AAD9KV49_RIDPI|nr:hypothetical protein NP493_570g00023 [Ridgeia piscesae]
MTHDMPNTTRRPGPIPYSRASRSPVRSGVRLSPLKASRDTTRHDHKFGAGNKVHDGTSSRVGSASGAPTSSRASGIVHLC